MKLNFKSRTAYPWCSWRVLKYLSLGLTTTLLILFLSLTLSPTAASIPPQRLINSVPIDTPPVSSPLLSQSSHNTPQLVQQGRDSYHIGEYTQAITLWQQAADTFASQGDTFNQALILSNLALAYQKIGQWTEANQAIATSLQILQKANCGNDLSPSPSPDCLQVLAPILNTQANLQLAQGNYNQALITWEQAANLYHHLNDTPNFIGSVINQAHTLRVQGYYRRAYNTLEQVRQTLDNQPDSLTKAAGLRSIADLLHLLGQTDSASQTLSQSLAIARRLQSPTEITSTLISLGNNARSQQQIRQALTYYQEAATTAPSASSRFQAQVNQFSLLVTTQQLSQARTLWTQLQSQLPHLPLSHTTIYAQINLAQTLNRLRQISPNAAPQLSEIAQSLATTVQQAKELNDLQAESYALGYLGTLYETSKQWYNSQDLTQQALTLAQKINAPELIYRWQWQLARLHKVQGNRNDAIAAYTEAVSALQSLRRDIAAVNPDLQFSFRDSIEPLYRQFVALLLTQDDQEQTQTLRAGFEPMLSSISNRKFLNPPLQDDQEQTQTLRAGFVPTLSSIAKGKSLNPPLQKNNGTSLHSSNPQSPIPNHLKQARQLIEALQVAELNNFFQQACLDAPTLNVDQVDQTAAVIYPIILNNRLDVILSLPGSPLQHYSTPVSAAKLTEISDRLQQALYQDPLRRGIFSTDTLLPLAQQLYDWLIRPAESAIAASHVQTLVFIPDGVLRNLPMTILHDGQHYLIENYSISLNPGLQLLDPKPLPETQLKALTAGLTEARPNFPPLENVTLELNQIQATLPSEILLDQDFTSTRLKDQLTRTEFPIVHLATHGQFSSNAEDTFILAYDRPLNVHELGELLRRRTQAGQSGIELFVLSACQTAAGDDRATLGLAGVAIQAGARSTLATLWSVSDRATAEFMKEFYQKLIETNSSKAEALRYAQRHFLDHPDFHHPFFWSPYILVGNWL
ncbi:MAG: CHAT domain-containing protein [Coleofasciculus sp. B1-GNL1-01]|uniref:CHAT domain-containing protein n=1 Tax=Coleofasciculus sp. B1-GNL1-01 TaxID=3068484 RepID=UPI0032F43CFB